MLFRSDCKGTSRLNIETNLITPLKQHNHNIEAYQTDIYQLKTRCKTIAKNIQINLRKVFDDVTRNDPCACDISFRECESSLYRARRTLQPKIPYTAEKFCELIPNKAFGQFYQFTVARDNQIAVVFYSDKMRTFLSEITNIQFDGTFFTVPVQFSQLWTIFASVGRHTPSFNPMSNDCKNPNFISSSFGSYL